MFRLRKWAPVSTVQQTRRRWRKDLMRLGWAIEPKLRIRFSLTADFVAEKLGGFIVVKCSGSDIPLNAVHVRDLCGMTVGSLLQPVFSYGEAQLDPLVLHEAEQRAVILLPVGDAGRLEMQVRQVSAKVIGEVDVVRRSGRITGWAKRAHNTTPVRVVAVSGGEILGEAVANLYRKDLESLGNGRCGFEIVSAPVAGSMEEFVGRLAISVYADMTAPTSLTIRRSLRIVDL